MATQTGRTSDNADVRPAAATPVADEAVRADGRPPAPRAFRWANPSLTAIAVWLLGAPVAFAVPRLIDADPFTPRAWSLAVGLGLLAAAAGYAVTRRWNAEPVAGVAAGALAVWVLFTLRLALDGTPFGFSGLQGDGGRLAAGATDFAENPLGSGGWIPDQPREYPPLYLMIVGRVAAWLGEPGWRLLADAEVVGISFAVLACFLMWRRVVPAWVAFAISTVLIASYLDARKPYEVISLYLLLPWALATFGRPLRGRLHWLPAGVIGGLIVLTYQGWLVFGALGILALIVMSWRAEPDGRRSYVRHLVGVTLVAFVVSSWYVVPYIAAVLGRESRMISDMYTFNSMLDVVFPFANPTPSGVLQLIGLVGLLWLRRTTWWAMPLLLLGASAFLYRALMMVSFARSGHTAFAHYAVEMVVVVLSAAGVLVLVHATPVILRRLAVVPPRHMVAALMAVVVGFCTYSFAMRWMPGNRYSIAYSAWAHQEPLADGRYPTNAPAEGRLPWFPVEPIEQAVEGVLGDSPRPVSLSADDRLYAFLPWPGYLTTSRFGSGTFVLVDQRIAEVRRLTGISDPAEFARASAGTKFGPIDIFILEDKDGAWQWRGLSFQESQFDPAQWTVITDLPENVVVAIRR